MPDNVQELASANLFNGLLGLGNNLRHLDLRDAARLLQAVLSVVADITTRNWLALPGDLKTLLTVIAGLTPEEHHGAVVAELAFADTPHEFAPDGGEMA